MVFYFYVGLTILIISEILLFSGVKLVGIFFTPLIWTGYILFIDGIILKIKEESWINNHGREFLVMIPLSAIFWYLFEFFNLFIKNWRYEGLPQFWITAIGMTWAFATIGPGIIETSGLIEAIRILRFKTKKFEISKNVLYILIIIGIGCIVSIFITPPRIARFLGVPLWLGFFLLFDPINYLNRRKSVLYEIKNGNLKVLFSLFVGGFICGFLWEFWNFWAITKWAYRIPYEFGPKIFEMPLFGYLGFPLLALEYFAFYNFALHWRQGGNYADNHR